MKIDGIKGMDCKVCFTSVFTQVIDLYKKNENNLHETLINLKKVIYITHLNTHYTHDKKGAVKPLNYIYNVYIIYSLHTLLLQSQISFLELMV